MGLKTCKECGGQISSSATACPHCGRKIRRTSLVTWIVTIFLAVTAITSINAYNRRGMAPTQRPVTDAQRVDEARNDLRFTRTAIAAATLKKSLREPDSVRWSHILANDDATTICLEYRARNGFGGMAIEHVVFHQGAPSRAASDWNQRCAGHELHDMSAVQHALK